MKFENAIRIIEFGQSEKKDVWKVEIGAIMRAESEEVEEREESMFGHCVSDVRKELKKCIGSSDDLYVECIGSSDDPCVDGCVGGSDDSCVNECIRSSGDSCCDGCIRSSNDSFIDGCIGRSDDSCVMDALGVLMIHVS